jgi:hypothetical protein
MRILMIGLIALGAAVSISHAQSQSSAHPIIANEADFASLFRHQEKRALSNTGVD